MSQCLIHFCLLVQFCCWNSDPFHHTDAQSWLQTNRVEQELHFFNFRSFLPFNTSIFIVTLLKIKTNPTLPVPSNMLLFWASHLDFVNSFCIFSLPLLYSSWIFCEILYVYVIDLLYFIHLFFLSEDGILCPFNFFVRCNCVINVVKAFVYVQWSLTKGHHGH